MRKIIILFIIVLLFLLSGCSSSAVSDTQSTETLAEVKDISPYNDYEPREDISLEVIEVESDSSLIVRFTMSNNSDKELLYGAIWKLEIQKDNQWYPVEYIDGINWVLVQYALEPDHADDLTISPPVVFESLQKGHYRLLQPNGKGTLLVVYFNYE